MSFQIENGIDIQADNARVLEALSTQKGIESWWTVDASVNEREATYRFLGRPGGGRTVTFRVEHKTADKLVLRCVKNENNPDWQDTELRFEVKSAGSAVRVELKHSGYPAKNVTYDECTKGWAFFLGSLKSYLETGTGTPFGM